LRRKNTKTNYLLEKIASLLANEKKGKLLDLGCGDGDYSFRFKELGFDVIAADLDEERFKHGGEINFKVCDVAKPLPFSDEAFDYIIAAELIEHLKNPYAAIVEINRILKRDGKFILSTPNVLNLKSRLRYLFEGCLEYFREPPLEQSKNPKEVIFNLHLIPWRYPELEYLLVDSGFVIEDIFTSVYEGWGWGFMLPLILLQAWQKTRRSLKKGGLDYRRVNGILLSKELLFGRHLIVKVRKCRGVAMVSS